MSTHWRISSAAQAAPPAHPPPPHSCSYPNLGVDERSQFDLVGDVPGGLDALRDVISQFNARGVRVGIPYNPCSFSSSPLPVTCNCDP